MYKSKFFCISLQSFDIAPVAELVDALDSKSCV